MISPPKKPCEKQRFPLRTFLNPSILPVCTNFKQKTYTNKRKLITRYLKITLDTGIFIHRPWNIAAAQTSMAATKATFAIASKTAGYGASGVIGHTAISSILPPDYSIFQNLKQLKVKGEKFIEMNGL